jgi:molecular chaperone Hsp33
MSDVILRCLLPDPPVRVVAAMTTETAREAARRHRAGPGVAVALGRAATAGALLATLTKDVERVTLQILGTGPLGAITVDVTSAGGVRAFVKHPQLAIPASPGVRVSLGDQVGHRGLVGVVRDLGLKEPLRGQTEMVDGEIDSDVEHYLVHSEQIDSALGCEALVGDGEGDQLRVSAGVLVQALPGAEAAPLLADARARLHGGLLTALLGTAGPVIGAVDLARAALGEAAQGLKVLEQRPLGFFCPCTRDRAAATLTLLGPRDLAALAEEDGGATVVCEFCRESYPFSAGELEELVRRGEG